MSPLSRHSLLGTFFIFFLVLSEGHSSEAEIEVDLPDSFSFSRPNKKPRLHPSKESERVPFIKSGDLISQHKDRAFPAKHSPLILELETDCCARFLHAASHGCDYAGKFLCFTSFVAHLFSSLPVARAEEEASSWWAGVSLLTGATSIALIGTHLAAKKVKEKAE